MLHLRVIVPHEQAEQALEILIEAATVCNVVTIPGASRKPPGDLILCDVARGDASVIIDDLRQLGIEEGGSISIDEIDTTISRAAKAAEAAAEREDQPFDDDVVWEEVEERTSEDAELSLAFVEFMVLAALIAGVGIILDSPILIVGAMVVGPEFGPIAGICVAAVERRGDLAKRSARALVVGFPIAIAFAFVFSLVFKWTGLDADGPGDAHPLTQFISSPNFFSFFVAFVAGMTGILSLTSTKSGALIGVLVSITTIPAAANIGVAAAYGDWGECGGAAAQLAINLCGLVIAGVIRLSIPRYLYTNRLRRRRAG